MLEFFESLDPPLVIGVADFRADIEAANNRPHQVIALLFSGGYLGELAGQAFVREDRQHPQFIAGEIRHHLAEIAGHRLHVVAHQRGDWLAAAFKGHVAHLVRIDARFLRQQRGLHPVLAANRRARAKHHAVRIFLQRFHQIAERFPRRIGAHRDHAVIGTDTREPAHVIDVIAAKFALREIEQ